MQLVVKLIVYLLSIQLELAIGLLRSNAGPVQEELLLPVQHGVTVLPTCNFETLNPHSLQLVVVCWLRDNGDAWERT